MQENIKNGFLDDFQKILTLCKILDTLSVKLAFSSKEINLKFEINSKITWSLIHWFHNQVDKYEYANLLYEFLGPKDQ